MYGQKPGFGFLPTSSLPLGWNGERVMEVGNIQRLLKFGTKEVGREEGKWKRTESSSHSLVCLFGLGGGSQGGERKTAQPHLCTAYTPPAYQRT
jgi:hypothetical protein